MPLISNLANLISVSSKTPTSDVWPDTFHFSSVKFLWVVKICLINAGHRLLEHVLVTGLKEKIFMHFAEVSGLMHHCVAHIYMKLRQALREALIGDMHLLFSKSISVLQ